MMPVEVRAPASLETIHTRVPERAMFHSGAKGRCDAEREPVGWFLSAGTRKGHVMGERWLRSVEAYDGDGECSCEDCIASIINGCPTPHPSPHDLPMWAGGGGGAPGELTEVVLIDGNLVDVRRRPVQGSGYECAAYELEAKGLLRGPRVVERPYPVREAPHEAMLDWLTRVVGGEEALKALDEAPLPAGEELELSGVPGWAREQARVIDEHVQGAFGHQLVGPELLTACRRLLVRAAGLGAFETWRQAEPEKVAAGLIQCIAKANDLSWQSTGFSVRSLIHGTGAKGYASDQSRRLASLVGGSGWPHGRRPVEAPDVYVLGDAGLLLSRFRRDLMSYREVAHRVAGAS